MASSTAHQLPSAACTRSAWPGPTTSTPRPRCRWVRIGFAAVALVRAGHRRRPRDAHGVVELGAALGGEQVVGAVHLVQVGPLRPDGAEHGAVPQDVLGPDQRPGRPGRTAAATPRSGGASAGSRASRVPCTQTRAVVVEEERRVDAVDVEPDRVRPGPGRVGGGHQEVAAAALVVRVDQGADHPEQAVVVPDRRRVEPAGGGDPVVVELVRPG